jgi:hypothetical protein
MLDQRHFFRCSRPLVKPPAIANSLHLTLHEEEPFSALHAAKESM